jgi:hypothetical protein
LLGQQIGEAAMRMERVRPPVAVKGHAALDRDPEFIA